MIVHSVLRELTGKLSNSNERQGQLEYHQNVSYIDEICLQ